MTAGAKPIAREDVDAILLATIQALRLTFDDPGNVIVRFGSYISSHDQTALQALPSNSGGASYTANEAFAVALLGQYVNQFIAMWATGAVPGGPLAPVPKIHAATMAGLT